MATKELKSQTSRAHRVQRHVITPPDELMAEALFLKLSFAYRAERAKHHNDTLQVPPPKWKKLMDGETMRDRNEAKAYRAAAKWLLSIGAKCPTPEEVSQLNRMG